jgi:hypothetical protein
MTEERAITPEEVHKAYFVQLVLMLSGSALQQMGKLIDPQSKKAQVNLEAAQATIDLLDMIEAKTKGNLDKEEERMLRDTLMSLKMNFVETMEAGGGESAPADQPKPQAAPAAEEKKAEEIKPGPGDGKEPKFHKKY